ncbi:dihydroorotase [Magnetovibrio sp. PR-2]|uniref:dihydroorotase n=1 Tax=Magnetovibrio sp. PR-2 TaxID=3120356 RepID=UPI002FCE28E7
MTDTLTITRPDDWHVHVRDGDMMKAVLPYTAAQFGRAIIMPNLVPPVQTAKDGAAYRDRILAAMPEGSNFQPLMTAYLSDKTDPADLEAGFKDGIFTAAKLYPAGATTNSDSGVTDVANIDAVLDKMEELAMPLLVHGEVTDPQIDIFDREHVFIKRVMEPTLVKHQGLKVVFEHITTSAAVDFVRSQGPRIGATITVHHLMINRTDIFKGGIRPHMYCLPIAKREQHRLALREAATSGESQFFLGTDTAPHAISAKEAACGCAGIFSALSAVELYAQVFDEEKALDKFEAFASLNGPAFYGMTPNAEKITLKREDWQVPDSISVEGGITVQPFLAGETLHWKMA